MAVKKSSENTTRVTDVDPAAFIAAVEHPTRRADAETLLDMMRRVTDGVARMRRDYETFDE